MNRGELDSLIEKYYDGESTEEEEQYIREIFGSDNAPEGYETEKAVFGYYEYAGNVPEPGIDFESRIMSAIDASKAGLKSSNRRRYLLPSLSAAATILILFGSWFFFIQKSEETDTFTDPQIAYAETMKILLDVSAKMNRGTAALEPVRKIDNMAARSIKIISRSTGRIGKNLQDIGNVLSPLERSGNEVNKNNK